MNKKSIEHQLKMKTVNEVIPQQLPLLFQIPPPRSDFWREEALPNAAP